MPRITPAYKPVILTSLCSGSTRRTAAERMRRETGLLDAPLEVFTEYIRERELKPKVMRIAQEILNGGFDKERVEECGEGYRLKEPILIEAVRHDLFGAEQLRDRARLGLIASLSELGYRVALLAPNPEVYEIVNPFFLEDAAYMGVNPKDFIFLETREIDDDQVTMAYPRDLFVQLDNTIYMNPEFGAYNWDRFFAWAKGLKIDYSRIGFGGEVVIGKGFAFLSEQYKPEVKKFPELFQGQCRLLEMLTVGETELTLKDMGFKVYKIPTSWVDLFPPSILEELNTEKRFLIPLDHADMNLLHLPHENGIFISEPYYRTHKDFLDRILEEIKPDIFRTLPEEDGLPINSLPLPDGGVFMDKAARESYKIFADAGIRVETTFEPLGTWAWGMWGGIHCATNIVNLPCTS